MLDIFDKTGIKGHITWFLNENDFKITKNHASFLKEALKRADTLGVHDHIDWLDGNWAKGPIKDYCQKAKLSVETWLAQNNCYNKILYHRAGCLFQHPAEYTALRELGYRIISDIYPGNTYPNHTGHLSFDNREIPLGILPYWHDEDNFLDYKSKKGHFLQVPVMHMGLEDLNLTIIKKWEELFKNKGIGHGIFVWLFHPYEIIEKQDGKRREKISIHLTKRLEAHLSKCISEGMRFVNMEECLKELKY